MLYLCDEGGLPLHRIPPNIQAPGFEFSAYLKSRYNSRLNQEGTLDAGEFDPGIAKAIEDSKDQLRAHFKARQAEDTRSLVERWKQEAVYPYKGDPDTPVKAAESTGLRYCCPECRRRSAGLRGTGQTKQAFPAQDAEASD